MITVRSAGRMDEWLKQTPLKRLGKPEEVAALVAFIANETEGYITGASLNVTGGLLM
jgi:NAD(P)-dependent dehydrogenase (short-subunit alcohol dehydrogenase family)